MKITLIILGVIAIVCIVLELIIHFVSRRERRRIDAMSPEERRKYQEQMYRAHHFSDSTPM